MSRSSFVPWLLRIGVAMCFIGHGAFGILQKRDWLMFFNAFGIPDTSALTLMPLVGSVDIAIGIAALVGAPRVVFAYGAFWCLFTAALRPLAGLSAGELFERAGNFGIPIAMLALTAGQSWLARIRTDHAGLPQLALVRSICVGTTAMLLAGHGWLALQSKPLLVGHAALFGVDASMVPLIGVGEILLAMACVAWPAPVLLASICVWKIVSESAFILAGAPAWEFIERGGSYVAPLAALLLARAVVGAQFRPARLTAAATMLLVMSPALSAQPASLTPSLIAELQTGGLIVACRHAITSHEREDKMPPNFDDPSTQRVLSAEGEQQAIEVGRSLSTLRIRFGAVLASPFQRTRQTAQSMAGTVEIADALSSMTRGKDAELRALMTGPVAAGANRLVVTHQGLLYRVFRTLQQGSVKEGDCLIVRPAETGGDVAALVRPSDWHQAATSQ
jgi:phosphohistidine phosphatase SixA